MVVKNEEKGGQIFCCKICDYTTSQNYHYDKHLTTAKHKMVVNGSEKEEKGGKRRKKEEKGGRAYLCMWEKI